MKSAKKQYRIGHVAQQVGVEKFVIRFWEKEFRLNAHRSDGGQRFYEKKDIEQFKTIKSLLYDQGLTIAGARKLLETGLPNDLVVEPSQKTTMHQELVIKQTLSQDIIDRMTDLQKQL